MKSIFAFMLIAALLFVAPLAAKGTTTKITIRDTVSGRSFDITDEAVLKGFNVWSGPGTFGNDVEGTEGFIIDWASRVEQRPAGLSRYELVFYAQLPNTQAPRPVYVVFYEHDSTSRHGFVYLPGKGDEQYGPNVRSIYRDHGHEGHWFRAVADWDRLVSPLLPMP